MLSCIVQLAKCSAVQCDTVQCSVIQCSAEASEVQCGAMQNTNDTASYKQDFTKTWIGSRNLSELSSPPINREAKKCMVCTVQPVAVHKVVHQYCAVSLLPMHDVRCNSISTLQRLVRCNADELERVQNLHCRVQIHQSVVDCNVLLACAVHCQLHRICVVLSITGLAPSAYTEVKDVMVTAC